jgi:hypothetical protein
MKKKDKYKLINCAINEYGNIFKHDYERTNISHKYLKELLKKYRHSGMAEWSYCCYGLYQNCWQEPYFEGNWGMTQKRVDEIIYNTVHGLLKRCKRDNRVGLYVEDDAIHMVIVARDLPKYAADYLITFTNKEY